MTDEGPQFTGVGWNFRSHGTVTHSKDEYVRYEEKRVITTNTVEGFFSILKRGVYGVYQHVSEAHLHRYLVEFDFRYSNREKLGVNDTCPCGTRASRRAWSSSDLRNNSLNGTPGTSDIRRIASGIGIGTISASYGYHSMIARKGSDALPRRRYPDRCQPNQER